MSPSYVRLPGDEAEVDRLIAANLERVRRREREAERRAVQQEFRLDDLADRLAAEVGALRPGAAVRGVTVHEGHEIARWVGVVRSVLVPRTQAEREEVAEAGEADAFVAEDELPWLLVERSQVLQAAREDRAGRTLFVLALHAGRLAVVVEPLDVSAQED